MENNVKNEQELIIDWKYLFKQLLKKAWIMLLVGVIAGVASLIYTMFCVEPVYSSDIKLYVNNKSYGNGYDSDITASDVSASYYLVGTYIEILKSRTTLEEVSKSSGLNYSYGQLKSMISAKQISETEIFVVTVNSTDPEHAAIIANCIATTLPDRVKDIIQGSSMEVVDFAIVNPSIVAPSISKSVIVAFLIGFALTAAVIAAFVIFDDTIRNEDYILQTYDVPILSKIPDLVEPTGTYGKGYYKRYGQKAYETRGESK